MPASAAADPEHWSDLHPPLPEPILCHRALQLGCRPLLLTCRGEEVTHPTRPFPQLFSLQVLKLSCYLLGRPQVLHRSAICNRRRENSGCHWLLVSSQLSADLLADRSQLFHHRRWDGSLPDVIRRIILPNCCLETTFVRLHPISLLRQSDARLLQLGESRSRIGVQLHRCAEHIGGIARPRLSCYCPRRSACRSGTVVTRCTRH